MAEGVENIDFSLGGKIRVSFEFFKKSCKGILEVAAVPLLITFLGIITSLIPVGLNLIAPNGDIKFLLIIVAISLALGLGLLFKGFWDLLKIYYAINLCAFDYVKTNTFKDFNIYLNEVQSDEKRYVKFLLILSLYMIAPILLFGLIIIIQILQTSHSSSGSGMLGMLAGFIFLNFAFLIFVLFYSLLFSLAFQEFIFKKDIEPNCAIINSVKLVLKNILKVFGVVFVFGIIITICSNIASMVASIALFLLPEIFRNFVCSVFSSLISAVLTIFAVCGLVMTYIQVKKD